MNKYLIIGGVILLVGVGIWVYVNQAATPSSTVQPNTTEGVTTQQPAAVNPTVEKVSWHVELANPTITDPNDPKKYEQAISIDATFSDKSTKRYSLGKSYGCDETNIAKSAELGRMRCNFADSGSDFVALMQGSKFVVEREDVSAKDGSVQKTTLLEI